MQVTKLITRGRIPNGREGLGLLLVQKIKIFVKYGSMYLRENPCHVRAVGDKGKLSNTNTDLCEQGKEVDSTKEKTTDNEDEEITNEESIEKTPGNAQESDMEPAVEEFPGKNSVKMSKILLRLDRQVQI